jgi:hypothetical protein
MRAPNRLLPWCVAPLAALLLAAAAIAEGPHWTPLTEFTTSFIDSIAVTATDPSFVIAFSNDGVFRSSDRGESWVEVFHSNDGPYFAQAFDPRFPRTLYSFGNNGQADGLFVSALAGREQRLLPVPFVCDGDSICDVQMSAFAIDPFHPDTVFVAGSYFFHFQGGGIFLLSSSDAFATWQSHALPAPLVALAFAPDRPGVVYALTCAGFLKSEDSTASWRPAGHGLPASLCYDLSGCPGCGLPVLRLDPERPEILYVGAGTHGVYQSSNGGRTFRPMSAGIGPVAVASLLVDPTDSGKLYAGVAKHGVFKWSTRQQTWIPLNAGLPVQDFGGVVALDPRHPSVLYAGTLTQGVFRLDPP